MSADWERFLRSGRGTDKYVCVLSAYLNGYVQASSREIRISHEYVKKAVEKHGLGPEHLPILPLAIRHGEAAHDRARHLTFLYWSPEFSRWFQVTVKCCFERRQLFVTTFHGLSPGDVARRRKRYETVWPIAK